MIFLLFQMYIILQDVQFTEQQRFKQFVSQSKARMEVLNWHLCAIYCHKHGFDLVI
jgi:hypothetical protein